MPHRQNLAQPLSRSAHSESRRAPPERAKPLPQQFPSTALFQANGKVRHSVARSRCQTELPRIFRASACLSLARCQVLA